MQYKPKYNHKGKVVIFDLLKPIYNQTYGIWDRWLKHKPTYKIVINTPNGTSTYKNFADYKKYAKRTERYYRNPNVPMIFWCRDIKQDVMERDERKVEEKKEIEQGMIDPQEYMEARLRLKELFLQQTKM